ncbi:unnamed protein product, partial [Owenia fusiformis]
IKVTLHLVTKKTTAISCISAEMKNLISIFGLMCLTLIAHAQKEIKIKRDPRKFSEPGKTIKSRCHHANERYIVENIPPIFRLEKVLCDYYRCDNSYYEKTRCPDGIGIGEDFLETAKAGIAHSLNPCNLRTEECAQQNPIQRPDLSLCGMDLMLVIDMSCSISDANKTTVIKFVNNLIRKFRLGPLHVKIAGVSYASKVNNIQTFKEGRSRPLTLKNFDKMVRNDSRCHTVTHKALEAVRDIYFTKENGDRGSFKNVMIVATDGNSYEGKKVDKEMLSNQTIALGTELRERGVMSMVIALPKRKKGALVGMNEWLGIAGDPKNVLYMNSFEELENKTQLIADKSCVVLNEA